VASEIVARVYLTIGFMALIMLTPLAITSTNGMMRRMGGMNWRRLHILVYPILGLATVHFFIQSKLGVTEPIVVAALGAWLMLWRLLAARLGEPRVGSLPGTVALAAAVVVGTALGEALYYHWKVGVAIGRVLPTNFLWKAGTRPAWIVLGIALVVIAVAVYRALRAARKPRPQRGASARNPRSPSPQPQGKAA
jgi:sulfoxide reductase heme-binding subunit YedZ